MDLLCGIKYTGLDQCFQGLETKTAIQIRVVQFLIKYKLNRSTNEIRYFGYITNDFMLQ